MYSINSCSNYIEGIKFYEHYPVKCFYIAVAIDPATGRPFPGY